MNFYELLISFKKEISKRFSDLTQVEINRLEKELRLENKMNAVSDFDTVLNFIKALQESPLGLDFLIDNPNLSKAIFIEKPRFNDLDRMRVNGYQRMDTKGFFSDFLYMELENAISEAAVKSDYSRLEKIAAFNQYLPEEIVLLLKTKISDKLNFIEMRVKAGIIGVARELDAMNLIIIVLGDQNLARKKKFIERMSLNNSLKDVGDPGIVSFFKMIGEFTDAISTQPKNVIEKEKKQETIWGCGWVFLVTFIIILCCFIFVKSCMPEPPVKMKSKDYSANHLHSDKFPAYLTDFNRFDISEYQYIGANYRGVNPLNKHFGIYPYEATLLRGPKITNNCSYDLIIFSTDNLMANEDAPNAAAEYIASGDSGKPGAYYLHRLYFGDSLSLFNTHYDKTNSITKRFLMQPKFSKKTIQYRILFRTRSTITLRDTLERIYIEGEGSIELHNSNGSTEIKMLPFIFPPTAVKID